MVIQCHGENSAHVIKIRFRTGIGLGPDVIDSTPLAKALMQDSEVVQMSSYAYRTLIAYLERELSHINNGGYSVALGLVAQPFGFWMLTTGVKLL